MADIRLEKDKIVTDGNLEVGRILAEPKEHLLWVNGYSIMLDQEDRRGQKSSNDRAALTHDERDRLSINYNRAYTGGVEIRGPINIPDPVTIGRIKAESSKHLLWINGYSIMLDQEDRRSQKSSNDRAALTHDEGDKLTLNYNRAYAGGVEIRGPVTVQDPITIGRIMADPSEHLLWINGSSIMLDMPERRDLISIKDRAALTHDYGDILTLNYNKAYKGGVEIRGPVSIPQSMKLGGNVEISGSIDAKGQLKITDEKMIIEGSKKMLSGSGSGAGMGTAGNYPERIVLESDSIRYEIGTSRLGETTWDTDIDVIQEIRKLRNYVKSLRDELKKNNIEVPGYPEK